MKFTVREGFVVHDTKIVTVKQAGKDVKQPQTNTYYEGNSVDFDEVSATEHAHKLEPADKAAENFVNKLFSPSATAASQLDHGSAISALTEQISALTALVTTLVSAPQASEASAPAAETGIAADKTK